MKLVIILLFVSINVNAQMTLLEFDKMGCVQTGYYPEWYLKSKVNDDIYEFLVGKRRRSAMARIESVSFKTTGVISQSIFLKKEKTIKAKGNSGFEIPVDIYRESTECLEFYLTKVSTQLIQSNTYPRMPKLWDKIREDYKKQKAKEKEEKKKEMLDKEKMYLLKKISKKGYEKFKEAKCYFVGYETPWRRSEAGYANERHLRLMEMTINDNYFVYSIDHDYVKDEGKTTGKLDKETKGTRPLYTQSNCKKIIDKHLNKKLKRKKRNNEKRKELYK